MDRIKYRVWCSNKKEYEKDRCLLTEDGRLFQEAAYGNMQPLSLETHIVEQCTGLKDKNGVLIFEGDIVFVDKKIGYNKPQNYSIVWQKKKCGFGLKECGYYENVKGMTYGPVIEVIGNIHDKED